MSRHRLPAVQGWILFDLTMMFGHGRAIGASPHLAPKPSRSLALSQRYDGLERGFAIAGLFQLGAFPFLCPFPFRSKFALQIGGRFSFPFSAMRCGEEEPWQQKCRHPSSGLVSMLA